MVDHRFKSRRRRGAPPSPQRFFCWRCQSASYFPCLASVEQCSSFVVRSGVMDPFQIIHGLNGLGRGISVKRVFTYCTCRRTEREYVGHRAERRRFRDRQAGRQAGNNRVWSEYGRLDLAYSDLVEETQTAFGNLKIQSQLDDANSIT